jgi:cytochrome P450
VVDFDHHSPDYADNHPKINAELREKCPVAWSENYKGFWVVSKYEDVANVSRDDDVFRSHNDQMVDPDGPDGYAGIQLPPAGFRSVPIEMDPPEFFDYRKLLNPYFSPAAAKRWTEYVELSVEYFLDQVSEAGSGDLVLDLAAPMPGLFTTALIGLPKEDWFKYAEPFHKIVAPQESEEFAEAVEGAMWIMTSLFEIVEQRRAEPQDDFISYLTRCTVGGELLEDQRIVEIVFLFIAGGVDTTTSLMGNAFIWLDEHRDVHQSLLEDDDVMAKAVEEFLRFFSPVQTLARTVSGPCEFAGQDFSELDRVLINLSSANRDPAVFENAEDLDINRFPNRHAAFGLGIHRCLGSNFARILITAMTRGVLRRMPDFQVDRETAERYQSIGTVNGWHRVPATWTPVASTGQPMPDGLPFVEVAKKG